MDICDTVQLLTGSIYGDAVRIIFHLRYEINLFRNNMPAPYNRHFLAFAVILEIFDTVAFYR